MKIAADRPVQMGSSPRADRFDSCWRMAQNRAFRKEIEMERELEKDLKEIEYLIYVHKNRGNTNTQSVLERVYEIIEPCAKAAKTLPELEKLLSRENTPEITRSSRDNKCGECSRRTWYMKEYKDALKEDGVSEAFLEDCKRVAQKYKKDNDGWIPVEERLPIPNKEVWVTVKRNENVFTSTDIMTERGYFINYEKGNILAWKEKETIPEPYRPERSNDEKE